MTVTLESPQLRVAVLPAVGGTITEIRHRALGSVLGTVPWRTEATPLDHRTVENEPIWLTRFTGGWPLLFPNAGDACSFAGVFHGFHGEASISPWLAEPRSNAIRLTRRFDTVPVEMQREISVTEDVVTLEETVRMHGAAPIQVMWGQHATFGSDLLAGPFALMTGAHRVLVDEFYDPPTNPLRPGAVAVWPIVPGKQGVVDLSRPAEPLAALGCLADFETSGRAWAGIRRQDDSLAAVLSWDAAVFPYAWLWMELGGTTDAPWSGKARMIGLEPNTTWPANGLAEAARRGGALLTVQPGQEIRTTVRLQVLKPTGEVRGVDAQGRAIFDRV